MKKQESCRGVQRAPWQQQIAKKEKAGISLITLIITIIVIIILAAIVIFTGLNTPDRANFAKFAQTFADFQTAVTQDFLNRKQQYAIEGSTRTDAQIYYEIANGIKVTMTDATVPVTTVTELQTKLGTIYPSIPEGTEVYEIKYDTNVANWNAETSYYEPRAEANDIGNEHHFVTDTGEAFILPGYKVTDGNETRWYVNSSKYYTGENEKRIAGGGTQGGQQPEETDTQDLDLLKDYVLGKVSEETGVRPGKDEEEIFDYVDKVFMDDPLTIANESTVITYLNEIGDTTTYNYYIRYNNAAYKIVENSETYKIMDVEKVYEPASNSREGKKVQYKANEDDETATDWLVLYDNGDTLDIMSIDTMGSCTLGAYDDYDLHLPGNNDLEEAMDSYENAISRLNAYCEDFITNSTVQKVRSVGTQFDISDTTERYSSTFLANYPISSPGMYNGVGKTEDMNSEQDIVRMSYYGYVNTGSSYWLASRFVEGDSYHASFEMRYIYDDGGANYNAHLWSVSKGEIRPRQIHIRCSSCCACSSFRCIWAISSEFHLE